jgi:hydroxymethylglutaryl-CoA lyase
MNASVKLIECPRDAMQGIHDFIPTELKIRYLNALLRVGFDTLDFGSFVSPKAIPQLADTAEVLAELDFKNSTTHLLAIVANLRGAEAACAHAPIRYIGYPFSISETFQLRNTNHTIAASLQLVREMQALCAGARKELVVYISMGFGNPYGDEYSPAIAAEWVEKIAAEGVKIISLADTVGNAVPETITSVFNALTPRFTGVELGGHFHSTADTRKHKLRAAWDAGCRRFDTAMRGFGGCPFAEDELVGNIATETFLEFMQEINQPLNLNLPAFNEAMLISGSVFDRQ